MKRKLFFLSVLAMLLAGCSGGKTQKPLSEAARNDTLRGTLQLSGAFALYPMAVKWAEDFRQLHPYVKIDISGGGAGKGMTDALAGVVDIGMVSREVYPEEVAKGAFPIAVVKDAVVPTVNARNPVAAEIRRIGLSREKAARLWNGEMETWGQALGIESKIPVHVFTRSDACGAAETFAAWLGKRQEGLKGTAVFGDPGVASAIQKDRVGIGFNNIAYVYDQDSKKPYKDIAVIPLDLNGDGQISAEENFYDNADALIKAIKDGRFPSPPARDLYMVTKGKPKSPALKAFLNFILSEGQKNVGAIGYIGLSDEQLKAERNKVN